MAIGWSFKKTRLAERAKHAGRDFAQPFKDLGNGFRSLGVSAGFYTKAVDAFAEVSANGKAGESAGERCSFRDVLLKVLLGISGNSAKGVKQSLKKPENKYDSASTENKLKDYEAQKVAVDNLKKNNKLPTGKINESDYGRSDIKAEIDKLVNNYKKTNTVPVKGKPYILDDAGLEDMLKATVVKSKSSGTEKKPTADLNDKSSNLQKKVNDAKKDKKESSSIISEFKKTHDNLENAMTLAEGFLKPFGKKTQAAHKRFDDKSKKLQAIIADCKPKEGREASEIKKIQEASKSANKAYRTLLTLQGAQVAGYRRITEGLIDAWIDLHRLVEKHNSTDPVISERYQKVILLIRKENRTYFLKESIDEKQKIKNVSEDAGNKITEALDKETISKKGKKLALEKTGGK